MNKAVVILAILFGISCKAQSPVVGLDAPSTTPKGAYYKDLNGELNKFVGTWKYTNGGKTFIITLAKKEKKLISDDYYDTLAGEYSYTVNGEEIVNTFPLNTNENYNIGGSYISKPNERPKCDDCAPNERRIDMYFEDPERKYLNSGIVLRFTSGTGGNPPKIEATLYQVHGAILPEEDSPVEPRVPYGEYLLEKQ